MPDYSVAQFESQRLEIACLQRDNDELKKRLEAAEADWRRTSLCAEVRANADLRTKLAAAEALLMTACDEFARHDDSCARNSQYSVSKRCNCGFREWYDAARAAGGGK
jgi:hypothetical protein